MEVSIEEKSRYLKLQMIALNYARYGNMQELELMIEAKMPINLSDQKGNTLLMLASYNGNEQTTQMLIDRGALVDKKNDRGQTPLAGVCFKGYLGIAKILVRAGANIFENNGMGATPIMFASIFGNYDIVEYLSKQSSSNKSKLYLILSKFTSWIKNRRLLKNSKRGF